MTHPLSTRSASLRLAFGGLAAMAVGIGIGRFVYTPILPAMIVALGLSKSVSGLIASANFLGYLAGALLAARASLPGPPRAWLPVALAVSAATTLAMGLTTSVAWFIVLRFLGGVASALALILSSAVVMAGLAAHGRPRLGALHFAGVGVGIFVSAAIVAVLQAAGADWAVLWVWVGVVGVAGAAFVIWALPAPAAPAMPVPVRPGTARVDPALRRMVVAYGLFGFGYVITATFLVTIVRETAAVRALEPVVWVLVGLGAAPSVALWSALAWRIGTARSYAAAAVTEAMAVLISLMWPDPVGLCVAAILFGGTFMGLTALGLQRARELAAGDPRRAMAAMTVAFGVGQIVGPLLAGTGFDLLGSFTPALLVAAVALVVAAWLAGR